MAGMIDIEAFRADLSGTAPTRGDDGYDEARSAWNGEINRYPAVIARCRSAVMSPRPSGSLGNIP